MKIVPVELWCTSGTYAPLPGGTPWTNPPTCYEPNGCVDAGAGLPPYNNEAGTGYTVNDNWGPAIAFAPASADKELVATWYDTHGDPNNNLVNIWGGYVAAASISGPLTKFQVGANSGSPSGQVVPWNHTLGVWWDYQALATNPSTYSFLAAWGGDARLGDASTGIWSSVIK
jgi:hypothetical protein